MALYHPRVELRVTGTLRPRAQTHVGIDSARAYLQAVVDDGRNCRVDDLELLELGDSVIARGWMAAPANATMRWQFEFDDDLIARVVPLAGDWAVLGGRGFTIGQVAGRAARGHVELSLSDGRSLLVPITAGLEPLAAVHEPVLAYFDGGRLAGWYLPDHQQGMDLR